MSRAQMSQPNPSEGSWPFQSRSMRGPESKNSVTFSQPQLQFPQNPRGDYMDELDSSDNESQAHQQAPGIAEAPEIIDSGNSIDSSAVLSRPRHESMEDISASFQFKPHNPAMKNNPLVKSKPPAKTSPRNHVVNVLQDESFPEEPQNNKFRDNATIPLDYDSHGVYQKNITIDDAQRPDSDDSPGTIERQVSPSNHGSSDVPFAHDMLADEYLPPAKKISPINKRSIEVPAGMPVFGKLLKTLTENGSLDSEPPKLPPNKSQLQDSTVQTPTKSSKSISRGIQHPNRPQKHVVTVQEPPSMSDASISRTGKRPRKERISAVGDLSFSTDSPTVYRSQGNSHKRQSRLQQMQTPSVSRPCHQQLPTQDLSILRPQSQGSNVSKRRQPAHVRQELQSPDQTLMFDTLVTDFGQSWNDLLAYCKKRRARSDSKISSLQVEINEQNDIIVQLQEDYDNQSSKVAGLAEKNTELSTTLQEWKEKLETSSSKVKQVEEKCREYKKHLNEAVEEQQRLYKKFKESSQMGTKELRRQLKEQVEAKCQTLATSEAVRAEIEKKVAAVVIEARLQAGKLTKNISVLNVKLQERQRELSRERESVQTLRKELDLSRQMNMENLQSLSGQNETILQTLQEQGNEAKNREMSANNHAEKLDTVIKTLEEVRSKASDPSALLGQLQEMRDGEVTSIVTEIQKVIADQDGLEKDKKAQTAQFESITTLCEDILKHVKDTGDLQQRHQKIVSELTTKEQDRQELENALEETSNSNRNLSQENECLERRVSALQKHNEDLKERLQHEEERKTQIIQLEQSLTEKDNLADQMGDKLKAMEDQLQVQRETSKKRERQMRNECQNLIQALETANKQKNLAVQAAIDNESKKMQERMQEAGYNAEERVNVAQSERAKLERDLQEANKKIQQLTNARVPSTKALRDLAKTIEDESSKVTALIKDIETAKEDSKPLKKQLEQWATDQPQLVKIQEMLNQIAKDQTDVLRVEQLLKDHANAVETNTNESETPSANQVEDMMPDDNQGRVRRVKVVSPFEEKETAPPPSIDEERVLRRQVQPKRPSMKRITRSVSKELAENANKMSVGESQSLHPAKPALVTHSSYNRPVVGGGNDDRHGSSGKVTAGGAKRPRSESMSAGNQHHNQPQSRSYTSTNATATRSQPSASKRQKSSALEEPQYHEKGAYGQSRPVLSRTQSHYFPSSGHSEELDMLEDISSSGLTSTNFLSSSFPTPGQRGGPLVRQPPTLSHTYGARAPQSQSSQGSLASSQTMRATQSQSSQRSAASSRTMQASQSQSSQRSATSSRTMRSTPSQDY